MARIQELAVFVHGQTAMSMPDSGSARGSGWSASARSPRDGPCSLSSATGPMRTACRWLRVRLPGRPNNSTGWIRKARTTRSRDELASRRRPLGAARDGLSQRARSSERSRRSSERLPPRRREGRYFVEETVAAHGTVRRRAVRTRPRAPARTSCRSSQAGRARSPCTASGTSAARWGRASSHGCVRLDTASITWIGERIGPGVPSRSSRLDQPGPSRWTTSPSTLSSPPGRRSLTMSQCTALSFFPPVYV